MIKKAGHIAVILILLVSTTGITFSKHCHKNMLFGITVMSDGDQCCNGPCSCCEDKVEFHRLAVDFVSGDVQVSFDEIPSVDLMAIDLMIDVSFDMDHFSNEIDLDYNLPPPKGSLSPSFIQSFLL